MKRNHQKHFKRNAAYAVLAAVTILAAVFAALAYSPSQALESGPVRDLAKVQTTLQLTVYSPDGALKASRTVSDDLILNNYLYLMQAFFTDNGGTQVSATLTDITNTARGLAVKATYTGYGTSSFTYLSAALGGYIQVGTGTTSEARTDYALETPQESAVAVSTPVYSNGNITFLASVSMTDDRDITEAGFSLRLHTATSGAQYFLVFHDVFSAVPTTNGDSITVQYTVQLASTGFTNNFGLMLAALFTRTAAPTTQTFTDIVNTARVATVYASTQTGYWLFDCDVGTPGCGVRVGTSSSAVSRSSYELGAPVESIVANSGPTISSGNVTMGASITMSADRTIREAGYYFKFTDTGGAIRTMLLWRALTGDVVLATSESIAVTFTVTH